MNRRELDERIRQVLADLSVLSEVPAVRVGRSSRDAEEALPRGVRPSLKLVDPNAAPSKEQSLFAFYEFHFARAGTEQARRVLLFLAEGDLAARKLSAPAGSTALGQSRMSASSEQRDERILAWYVGVHPLEAAILESTHGGYCSEENVKAVRRASRRDPLTGLQLEGWAGWSDEERVKRYNDAKRKGRGWDWMATEFLVAASTLRSWVERKKKAA